METFRNSNNAILPIKIGAVLAISTVILTELTFFPGNNSLAQSESYCDRYARDYAKRHASGGVLKKAATGAGAGALFGLILGDAGAGAAIGAAGGAIAGGTSKSKNKKELYDRAFNDCMRGEV